MLASDLKWCDLRDDWRKIAQDRGGRRCLIRKVVSGFNDYKEVLEKERKNEREKRKEEGAQPAALDWKCEGAWGVSLWADEGRIVQPCQAKL